MARSYRLHVKSRAADATKTILDIKSITRLSLETTMALFDARKDPTLLYKE